MTVKKDDLIREALENARRDRQSVEKVRDHILELTKSTGAEESESVLAVSDTVAKLSDVLTKMNAQLVELTKIAAKSEKGEDAGNNDSIFDEIESSSSGTSEDAN